jgi:hypothetical protein
MEEFVSDTEHQGQKGIAVVKDVTAKHNGKEEFVSSTYPRRICRHDPSCQYALNRGEWLRKAVSLIIWFCTEHK